MIKEKPCGFADCKDIWSVNSIERLQDLYTFVIAESKKDDDSVWCLGHIPKSYLHNGYCSAALKSLQSFLLEYSHEKHLLEIFKKHKGKESEVASKLNGEVNIPKVILDERLKIEGKDVLRQIKTRANQNVFRKIILQIYKQSCCVSGLNIPAINRASHIIPWAADKDKRMDPRNGICLSATYDAAFDRNLFSLDDDYRIILSKEIKDYYTRDSVKNYFLSKEGMAISLPDRYLPNKKYLKDHREKGAF
ncbi:MAG: HNH endonuclease [Fibrobacteria bacterium]|nr:HNH endonuclease [Fibrobacteria bacterium]